MTWNYRIIQHKTKHGTYYGLHEVYYKKNGQIDMWAPDAEVVGDSPAEIVEALAMMIRDATKTVVGGPAILFEKDMPGNRRKKK